MLKLVTGMKTRPNSGFTLIELLVVLVILAIAVTFAVLATGDFGQKKHFRIQSEQILESLLYGRFYAVLSPQRLSLKIDGRRITWQALDEKNSWFTLKHDKILKPHSLPKGIIIYDHNLNPKDPRITISPNGDIQPFKLILEDVASQNKITLSVDNQGEAHIET